MYRILYLLAFLSIYYNTCAQILPKEGSKLNYRLVGFSVPAKSKDVKYNIEIATGNYNKEDSFQKNISVTISSDKNNTIAELPAFGRQYTWRAVFMSGKSTGKSELHHFSTTSIPDLDTGSMRIRVTKNDGKYNGAYFFVDGTRGMYDMNGQPVWYMPSLKGIKDESLGEIRDLKLSPQGTITFLLKDDAYEINYNGAILWKTPKKGKVSGDSVEYYHHEFTRRPNGNYMVLGKEYIPWEIPKPLDSAFFHRSGLEKNPYVYWDSIKKGYYIRMELGTILEYDKKGTLLWSWRSSGYFKQPDPKLGVRKMMTLFDTHENSFYFDEKTKTIFLGFRNLSRILKIKYPEGKVLNDYRNIYKDGINGMGNVLFCYQHAARLSQEGDLYLFNNNLCMIGVPPRIIKMEMPATGDEWLKKVWEIDCPVPQMNMAEPMQFVAGGNVIELPDRAIFASLYGDQYSNIFIVTPDQHIVWSATPEKWNKATGKWEGIDMYRASIFTDQKLLERLVWGK